MSFAYAINRDRARAAEKQVPARLRKLFQEVAGYLPHDEYHSMCMQWVDSGEDNRKKIESDCRGLQKVRPLFCAIYERMPEDCDGIRTSTMCATWMLKDADGRRELERDCRDILKELG